MLEQYFCEKCHQLKRWRCFDLKARTSRFLSTLRFFFGVPQRIRTPGLLIRSQTLYPAELAAHIRELYYYNTFFQKNQVFFQKNHTFHKYFLSRHQIRLAAEKMPPPRRASFTALSLPRQEPWQAGRDMMFRVRYSSRRLKER